MAERGRGPGAFTVACGTGRAVVQAWHDEQRVERDRYAGLLAAGVTDAATLEPPVPEGCTVPTRHTHTWTWTWTWDGLHTKHLLRVHERKFVTTSCYKLACYNHLSKPTLIKVRIGKV